MSKTESQRLTEQEDESITNKHLAMTRWKSKKTIDLKHTDQKKWTRCNKKTSLCKKKKTTTTEENTHTRSTHNER